MALADIVARLRLNATNFNSELTRELSQAERRFGSTGSVIGRNLSEGVNRGLQDATSRVPVLGGALSGLSGPALGAAAAAGGIAIALNAGIRAAEEMQQELRRLDGVLAATGNNTGFDRSELVAFAEEMERAWATPAEEILRVQGTLATFDNISGPIFQRTIRSAADMAAIFGTDLATNAQTLGTILQNLGNGDVEGLSRGFRFLGTETLNSIRALAQAGQTAEAQEALFAALERRIGGSAERGGQGLTAAFFRLGDAAEDALRTISERTGANDGATSFIDSLASSVDNLTQRLAQMSPGSAAGEVLALLYSLQLGGPAGLSLANQLSGRRGIMPISGSGVAGDAYGARLSDLLGGGGGSAPPPSSARSGAGDAWFTAGVANDNSRRGGAPRGGTWPVEGQIRSGFGMRYHPTLHQQRFHNGVDIAAPTGTPVRARYDGVVEEVAVDGVNGRFVRIVHADGRRSGYAHLSRQDVTRGQRISEGDVIGAVGSTGRSTGPHLHYSETVNGRPVDPRAQGRRGINPDAERAELGSIDRSMQAGDRAAQERQRGAERATQEAQRQAEAHDRILRTGRDEIAQESERARIAGLRSRGLEREADIAEGMAQVQRRYDDAVREMPEGRRAAEAAVTAGLAEQLALYEQQAEAHAQIVGETGEAAKLSHEQRAAQEAALAAMEATLARAMGMSATLADQREVAESLVRSEVARNAAIEQGNDASRERAEINRKDEAAREEAERHVQELQEEARTQQRQQIDQLADYYETLFTDGADGVWKMFKRQGLRAIAELAAQWTLSMLSGQQPGMALFGGAGQQGGAGGLGSIFSLFGGGSAAGGTGALASLSSALPMIGAAVAVNSTIGKLLGNDQKKNGGLLNMLIGPFLTAAFASTKRGSSTITGIDSAITTSGNSSKYRAQSAELGGGVQSMLAQIANALGATVNNGVGAVSIGVRGGDFRVDPTGRGITKTKKGAIDFGKDEEAAIRAATLDLVRDGVIGGISDAAQRILRGGGDLDKALAKAVMIEEIPKLLKAKLDPVGAAIDALNEKWEKTIAALDEGGATAEQMAEAQQLYRLELDETKASVASASAGLKDYLNSLSVGPASAYSVRQQEEMAKAAVQPFLDKIAAEEGIDQAAYQSAAQAWLDIARQLDGSTGAYFDKQDIIMAATTRAIAKIDAAAPIRTYADPFVEKTASNTSAMTDQLTQIVQILNGMATNDNGRGSGGSAMPGFIGGGTGFAKN